MKNSRLVLLIMSAGCFLNSTLTHAAAFQFYELATPIIGSAGVGQAAVADDASTSYFNPAGMSLLNSSQVMLGSQVILPYANFSVGSVNTISGNNGGSAGVLAPGLGGYYVYHFSPKINFGISLTSPYGGAFSYDNHWVGRYVVQQTTFYTMDLNPTISYQVNSWLSVGGGFVYEYANLNQTVALPLTPTVDGQANINVANFAPSFNAGVLFTPRPETKIGIAFRYQIVHDLSGNTNFLNISATPKTTTKMVMASNVIASLAQMIGQKFTLLGELGWADWSSMKNSIITIDGYSSITPNNWNDTYRVGLGGRYQFTSAFMYQLGVSYDSSPTTTSKRLPDLPVDGQVRVGTGIKYNLIPAVALGISYEYMYLGKADIRNTSSMGVLAGSYSRNFANVFQASLNVSC
jgi:long-chain fatty acid transport protein